MTDVANSGGSNYQRIVESLDHLPALPAIVGKLIQVINSPETSADDAAGVIAKDPALTSKMIRLANSAFYGMPRSVSSVSSAVVVLGFNTIKSLVLSSSVVKMFPAQAGHSRLDRYRFWRHSIVSAIAARTLVRHFLHVRLMDPESAFCAGILHDVGRLIFDYCTPVDFERVCVLAREQKCSLLESERAVLGIDHAAVGRLLADRWALPLELEYAIVHHHAPQHADRVQELVAIVHIGDCIAHSLDAALYPDEVPPVEWSQAKDLLSLSEHDRSRILECVRAEIEKSDDFYAMISA